MLKVGVLLLLVMNGKLPVESAQLRHAEELNVECGDCETGASAVIILALP
jgi:hypothetical protein